jgi:hypothetical protein
MQLELHFRILEYNNLNADIDELLDDDGNDDDDDKVRSGDREAVYDKIACIPASSTDFFSNDLLAELRYAFLMASGSTLLSLIHSPPYKLIDIILERRSYRRSYTI